MKYICSICGYIYDEEKEGVPFDSLPDSWTCPNCGAEKAMFDPLNEKEEVKEEPPVVEDSPKTTTSSRRFVCSICGYVYDEGKEGVPFDSLPDSWTCPNCGAEKAMFDEEGGVEEAPVSAAGEHDDVPLSNAALSTVFSNLARASEKMYKGREQELFSQIAAWYKAHSDKAEGDASMLSQQVETTLSSLFPAAEATATAEGERGALRARLWAEKVEKMVQNHLARYEREGEAYLEKTKVWVCSVCGFVYVGDSAPALCPVCKVPSWKFEEVR